MHYLSRLRFVNRRSVHHAYATRDVFPTGLQNLIPQGMAATANGANVFAGGDPFGVYRSTNNGATWELVNNGLTPRGPEYGWGRLPGCTCHDRVSGTIISP